MIFLMIFMLALVKGSMINADEPDTKCNEPLDIVCSSPDPRDFPKSSGEEVDIFCRKLISFHNCASEFLETCDVDEDLAPIKSMVGSGALLRLCDKDSLTYELLNDNAECISEMITETSQKTGFCHSHIAELELETPDLRDQINVLVRAGESEPDRQLNLCLEMVFGIGCIGKELIRSNCEAETYELILWFTEKSKLIKSVCKDEYEPIMQEFVELMKFEMRK